MINYESAAVPKCAEQRVITAINNLEVLKFSPSVIFMTYGYSGFVVFCCILLLVSFSCRIRQCFCSSKIRFLYIRHFLHQQTILHMRKRFPEWVYCQVVWILGGSTLNSFLDGRKSNSDVFPCSRLFTYDIMKNFNCNISLWFFKSKFRSYIGKHFFNY